MKNNDIPAHSILFQATIDALNDIGGSGSNEEICEAVIERLKLDEKTIIIPHGGRPGMTELEYRLAWARTNLKNVGAIENSGRAVWALTSKGKSMDMNKIKELEGEIGASPKADAADGINEVDDGIEELSNWKGQLLQFIVNEMSPDQFERLAQRLLRESGFNQVVVTGKSGDGGIDGKGIVQISKLLSFHVFFQCKRYKGTVSSSDIRNFQGTMAGRAAMGLFITTGTFSRDARKEAIRDGAPPIDLLDGEQLAVKLKELKLGLKVVDQVLIDKEWYRAI